MKICCLSLFTQCPITDIYSRQSVNKCIFIDAPNQLSMPVPTKGLSMKALLKIWMNSFLYFRDMVLAIIQFIPFFLLFLFSFDYNYPQLPHLMPRGWYEDFRKVKWHLVNYAKFSELTLKTHHCISNIVQGIRDSDFK